MVDAICIIKFGYSAMIWGDPYDWRPHHVQEGCLLVPHKTKSNPEDINIAVILDEMTPHKALDIVNDEEFSTELGWNIPALKKALVNWYVHGMDGTESSEQSSTWESLQNDIATKVGSNSEDDLKPLKIVNFYSEEMPDEEGKHGVTHQIIVEDQPDSDPFIFEKVRSYESINQVVHMTIYHVGNGKIKSVKGLGHAIYYSSHVSNRMINNIVNSATIKMGLMLKPTGEVASESFRLVRNGMVTILPPNVEVMQQQYYPDIQSIADIRNLLSSVSSNNNGGFKAYQENTHQVERTGKEVELMYRASNSIKQDQASWMFSQRKMLIYEMLRRLLNKDYPKQAPGYKEHKLFVDRLKARGFTGPLLDIENWRIKIPYAIGMGDRSQAFADTNQMVKMKGSLDEDGRLWVDRQWWALRVGWDQVDNVVPRYSRDKLFTLTHAMAESENVDMMQGAQRTVAIDDPHKIHFDIHMKFAADLLKKVMEQQMDPEAGYKALQLLVNHLATHVGYMAMDETRSNQVEEAKNAIKQLADAVGQVKQMVDKIQQQRQKQAEEQQRRMQELEKQPTDREFALGKYKIDREAEVKQMDIQMQNQQRYAKTMTAVETKMQETEAKIQTMFQKAMAEIAVMTGKAEAQKGSDNE
jgi:hypothetical protein